MKHRVFIILILSIIVASLGIFRNLGCASNKNESSVVLTEEEPSFLTKSPEEGLIEALDYYGVLHPEIVYAQAVLETGHFKSNLCISGNNLFGLYNSSKNRYYTFNHWAESVEAYINYIQYRYKPPNDYYEFLDKIGYAEDPDYINKVKKLVKQYDERRGK